MRELSILNKLPSLESVVFHLDEDYTNPFCLNKKDYNLSLLGLKNIQNLFIDDKSIQEIKQEIYKIEEKQKEEEYKKQKKKEEDNQRKKAEKQKKLEEENQRKKNKRDKKNKGTLPKTKKKKKKINSNKDNYDDDNHSFDEDYNKNENDQVFQKYDNYENKWEEQIGNNNNPYIGGALVRNQVDDLLDQIEKLKNDKTELETKKTAYEKELDLTQNKLTQAEKYWQNRLKSAEDNYNNLFNKLKGVSVDLDSTEKNYLVMSEENKRVNFLIY